MSHTTITGLVTDIVRHGNTVNGNPILSVTLSTATAGRDGTTTLRVSHDSSISLEIENREYRETPHVFTLTRADRIASARVDADSHVCPGGPGSHSADIVMVYRGGSSPVPFCGRHASTL